MSSSLPSSAPGAGAGLPLQKTAATTATTPPVTPPPPSPSRVPLTTTVGPTGGGVTTITTTADALTATQLAALARGGEGFAGSVAGLPPSWSLGVVVGGAASGKTSLLAAQSAFPSSSATGGKTPTPTPAATAPPPSSSSFAWDDKKAVVSQLGVSPDEGIAALNSCGLASLPALLRPHGGAVQVALS
jgi:hypothetical protein